MIKKTLPDPEIKSVDTFVSPSNTAEVELVEIWSEVLKLEPEEISVTSNFFDLGGHSLRATLIVNRVEKEFGRKIPLQLFFRMPTIKEIANFLQSITEGVTDIDTTEEHLEEYNF